MAVTEFHYFEGFEEGIVGDFEICGDFFKTTEQAKDGFGSFKNKDISDRGVSYFALKVAVPYEPNNTVVTSKLSFDYKVSSEASYDKFEVYRNGSLVISKSGEIPWTNQVVNLSAGEHVFLFLFKKDSTTSSGLDSAFVDNIRLDYVSETKTMTHSDSVVPHNDSYDPGTGTHSDFGGTHSDYYG